ncbi:MAG: T9SS type A sorting domain-containing protein [Chlorobi bacterium]|nr:T9SS type A sorting domain-containing protein [Chlorobiota bacterium]
MKKFILFLIGILIIPFLNAQNTNKKNNPFSNLDKSKIKTGLLYEKIKLPVSKLKIYTATNNEFIKNPKEWREILGELKQASFEKNFPDVIVLKQSIKPKIRQNIFPVGIINFKYNSFKKNALKNGLIKVINDKIIAEKENIYDLNNVFSVSLIDSKEYTGKNITYDFSSQYYFSNYNKKPDYINADFDDGKGFQKIMLNDKINIKYQSDGIKKIKINLIFNSGELFSSGFIVKVSTPKMPTPDETWTNYTADITYNSSAAQGEVGIFFGNGNSDFTRPVIIVDGFDPGDTRDIAGLWDIANQQNMVENLLGEGYDFVITNFYGGDDYIQRNAMLVVKLIQDINARMTAAGTMKQANQIVVIGPSMGGLITRYAIRYMEQNNIPHNIRNWISFDSPQKGADIPLGLQHWVRFFAQEADVESAQEALTALSGPAAKQMLIYHYTATSGNTAKPNTMFNSFYNELNTMGFPQQTRIVSIANGSGYGNGQAFAPGEQVIRYHYRSWIVDLDGNVWAVPNQTNTRIFNGLYDTALPFDEINENIYVSNTLPYDGAPGGSRGTFGEMDAIDPGYGDIIAYYDDHAFIPSISSLCIQNTTNPYFNINANINSIVTPFDKIYYPSENQEHVTITPESYNWFYHEVINFAPIFTSSPVTKTDEDSSYSYVLSSSDENEWNVLTYELISKPDWLNFSAENGTLSGTPLNEDVGAHTVSVKVSDGLDENIQTFTINVINTNDPPLITSSPIETVDEDSQYSYKITATDEDPTKDVLTFSAVEFPDWLSFDENSATLSGTPLNKDVGTYKITLQVNDGTVDVDQTYNLTVINTNDSPYTVQNLENQTTLTGVNFSYTFGDNCFKDDDIGDVLHYTAFLFGNTTLPSWLNFDSETKTFNGIPYEVRTLNIEVKATDSEGAEVSENFTLTINENYQTDTISNNAFKIYPNPANEFIFIQLPYNKNPYYFDLYNINGEKILSQIISSKETSEINISHLSRGYYLIKLTVNQRQIFKKLVLE